MVSIPQQLNVAWVASRANQWEGSWMSQVLSGRVPTANLHILLCTFSLLPRIRGLAPAVRRSSWESLYPVRKNKLGKGRTRPRLWFKNIKRSSLCLCQLARPRVLSLQYLLPFDPGTKMSSLHGPIMRLLLTPSASHTCAHTAGSQIM